MPKVNRRTDRAHVIVSFDLNQGDFDCFVSEIKQSQFFPNLIGIEVKRPNNGNPVLGLGALLLKDGNNASIPSGDDPVLVEEQDIDDDEKEDSEYDS